MQHHDRIAGPALSIIANGRHPRFLLVSGCILSFIFLSQVKFLIVDFVHRVVYFGFSYFAGVRFLFLKIENLFSTFLNMNFINCLSFSTARMYLNPRWAGRSPDW
jgi:uncharacterized membrane protein YkgB